MGGGQDSIIASPSQGVVEGEMETAEIKGGREEKDRDWKDKAEKEVGKNRQGGEGEKGG